jgi:Protein of unknown function (DUF3006)
MTSPTLIVDAIEGDLARVELADGRYIDFPRAWLPEGVREGDHLRVTANEGQVTFTIDREKTEAAREAAKKALDAITDEPPDDFHI